MIYIDIAGVPFTRNTFQHANQVRIDPNAVENNCRVVLDANGDFCIEPAGGAAYPVVGTDLPGEAVRVIKRGVTEGDITHLFATTEDDGDDPVLLVHTESLRIPQGVPVEMTILRGDESMLVALRKGIVKYPVKDDEVELARWFSEEVERWSMTATTDNFEGVNGYGLFREAVLSFTIEQVFANSKIKAHRAQNTDYSAFSTKCTLDTERTALLDGGAILSAYEEGQRRFEEHERAKEERKRANELKHSEALQQIEESREAAGEKRRGVRSGRGANGTRGSVSEAQVKADSTEHSEDAANFLKWAMGQ